MVQSLTARPEPYVSAGTSPPADDAFTPGFSGLRCRACGTPYASGPVFVCTRCFGPLEATYDLAGLRGRLTRRLLDDRPATIWRFAELLPLDSLPTRGLRVGLSPLTPAPRLAARLGLRGLWIKDDSRNPT